MYKRQVSYGVALALVLAYAITRSRVATGAVAPTAHAAAAGVTRKSHQLVGLSRDQARACDVLTD